MRWGVRWAETMRASNGTPSASRISAAWRMVVQSDWLPMIRPTSGRRLAVDLAMLFSGDDIGNQLAFQLEDLVFQPELALLQALQLELVEGRLLHQALDHLVEVAVLALQGFQLGLDRLDIQRFRRVAHGGRTCPGRLATQPPAVYPFARPKGSVQAVGFSPPSVLELLARALCRRGCRRGLPRPAGTARLRREYIAVLLLARRLRSADAERRPPAHDPQGQRSLAGRGRAPVATGAAAPEGPAVAGDLARDG